MIPLNFPSNYNQMYYFISKSLSFINGPSLKNLFNQAIELAFEAFIC
jgi:hypothetical protein